ncbi:MAG TPA: SDR family NAD(P)-dependent oxidoreductase [Solirubrobacterales bacterium]|jgi:UDP-glucose 4-epimerase|nr:SDR family NAD(P)-dependent oxidoreductase [Solirubrobacterales bacterium]
MSARSTDDLTQAAAGGLRWIAYARVAIELMLFAVMVVLARLIPPAAFGIFAVVVIVQELAVTMPMEGVGGALVQRREVGRDHLQSGLVLTLATSLALAAVTVALAVLLVGPLFGQETELLVIATTPYFLFGAVYAIPLAVLRRRLDFRRIGILDVSQGAVRALATLALAFAGLDAPALVFGGMTGMAAVLVLALVFVSVPLPRWHPGAARDLLPYGRPAALATVAWTGFRNGDYAVIGSVLGPAQAGFYWRAYQLAVEYQSKVAVAMVQIAFPVLSRTTNVQELLALRQRMVQLQAVVLFPLLALLLLLAPVLVPWLFGSTWERAVLPTQILVLGGAAALMTNACGSALMAEGRARAVLGYGVAHFFVYIGAVVAVAPLGIAAVAITGSVVHAVFTAVAYVVLLRGDVPSPIAVLWRDVMPATVASASLVAVGVPVDLWLSGAEVSALPHMAAVGIVGGIAYLIALRTWFPASSHDLRAAIAQILPEKILPGRSLVSRDPDQRTAMRPDQEDPAKNRSRQSRLAGERILITGGAGTIGSTIADRLVERGAGEVVVLDDFTRGRRENLAWAEENGNVTVVEGDVRDRALVGELTEGIDVVFHQAAIRITQCAEEPRLAHEVLVDGTFNVVEAAAKAEVRKLVAASSASVYGMAEEFPTAELHHPYANDTLYGAAKTFGEGLLRSYRAMTGLDYVALRYFNVYGPRMDAHGAYTEVLIRWMERIAEGKPPLIFGDGRQTMDFVCVPDVARANVLAAESDLTGAVLNVAGGVETSLTELAQGLLRAMGSDLPVEHGPARKVNDVSRRLADTSAAEDALGFRAEIGLEEGLARLVAWWRATRDEGYIPAGAMVSSERSS